jgi:DNA-directed RNA polymerase subunit H (RpoH/RPB5)
MSSTITTIDIIVRSRPIILEILEARGYNVSTYKDVSPTDIYSMTSKKRSILAITAKKTPDGPAPKERAVVLYWTDKPYRLSAATYLEKILFSKLAQAPDSDGVAGGAGAAGGAGGADVGDGGDVEEALDPHRDEIIVLLAEPYHDVFTQLATTAWSKKIRISFFCMKNLISNPSKHYMVPPHRKLTSEEAQEVIKSLHMRSVYEFPHIKFHFDMQARVLGLVPGDVVEIQRPSETAGIYTFYRVCMP